MGTRNVILSFEFKTCMTICNDIINYCLGVFSDVRWQSYYWESVVTN